MFFNKRKKKKYFAKKIRFDADSALIDSKNLADFDADRFEGVIEKTLGKNAFLGIFVAFILLILFFTYKAYQYQIIEGENYAEKAISNFSRSVIIFSERGVVFDRNGIELIWNEPSEVEEYAERMYINKDGFSHILGFLSYPQKDKSGRFFAKEYSGKGGIEKYFNNGLNGKLGEKKITVNSIGEVVSDNIIISSEAGKNIFLSIDSRIQEIMARSLEEYIKEKEFYGGSALMMDIETGEIIAVVSLPEYSSKIMTEAKDKEKIKEYLADKRNPFLNKAFYGEYVPGSVVKPFVALAGLTEKLIWPKKKVHTNGKLIIPNPYFPDNPSIFRDWKNHGTVDLNKALAWSSNVYFYLLGGGFPPENKQGLGIERLEKYFKLFGFGEKTNIQEFSEKKGLVPTPQWKKEAFKSARPWNIGNTYYTAVGQFGFQVTPLQILVAISAIANNGDILEPRILMNSEKKVKRKIKDIDIRHFKSIQRAMRETVISGTTQSLNFDFLKIASKSGTAQIKGRTRENSWVVGFFPYEKPKYVFVFLAENGPKDVKQSVATAASWFFRDLKESDFSDDYFSY